MVEHTASERGEYMKDGMVIFYCKDDVIYPVALSVEQQQTLEIMEHLMSPLKIVNKPQGPAINLAGGKQ